MEGLLRSVIAVFRFPHGLAPVKYRRSSSHSPLVFPGYNTTSFFFFFRSWDGIEHCHIYIYIYSQQRDEISLPVVD